MAKGTSFADPISPSLPLNVASSPRWLLQVLAARIHAYAFILISVLALLFAPLLQTLATVGLTVRHLVPAIVRSYWARSSSSSPKRRLRKRRRAAKRAEEEMNKQAPAPVKTARDDEAKVESKADTTAPRIVIQSPGSTRRRFSVLIHSALASAPIRTPYPFNLSFGAKLAEEADEKKKESGASSSAASSATILAGDSGVTITVSSPSEISSPLTPFIAFPTPRLRVSFKEADVEAKRRSLMLARAMTGADWSSEEESEEEECEVDVTVAARGSNGRGGIGSTERVVVPILQPAPRAPQKSRRAASVSWTGQNVSQVKSQAEPRDDRLREKPSSPDAFRDEGARLPPAPRTPFPAPIIVPAPAESSIAAVAVQTPLTPVVSRPQQSSRGFAPACNAKRTSLHRLPGRSATLVKA